VGGGGGGSNTLNTVLATGYFSLLFFTCKLYMYLVHQRDGTVRVRLDPWGVTKRVLPVDARLPAIS